MAVRRCNNGYRLLAAAASLLQARSPTLLGLSRCASSATPASSTAAARQTPAGLTPDQIAKFHADGFLVVPNYLDAKTMQKARDECSALIKRFDPAQHPRSVFSTTNQSGDEYFLTSGDKISYFFEEYAFDKEGRLQVPLDRSLNKIGHALHILSRTFREITHDPRNLEIVRSLGIKQPVVPQSMYIFKQPGIGGEVRAHQDSTFLYTSPMTCTGFWVPLQDCSKSNGCLWAIPGSHRQGLKNNLRFVRAERKPSKGESAEEQQGGSSSGYGGGKDASGSSKKEMGFNITTAFTADNYTCDAADFVPLEIAAGSLVLIHGEVIHKSDHNSSDNSRHAYAWHVIESQGAEYDKLNWLQPTPNCPFPPL